MNTSGLLQLTLTLQEARNIHDSTNIQNWIHCLKRQEKDASENVVCWSRLLQIIA